MKYFIMLYFVANLLFVNPFYLLDRGNKDDSKIQGSLFFDMFFHVYLSGFGDFDIDNYHSSVFSVYVWVLFFGLTIFIQLVMLNLLIAVISESFARVTEVYKESTL